MPYAFFLFKRKGGGGSSNNYSDEGGGGMRKKSEIGGEGHAIFKLHSSKNHQPPLPHKKLTVPKPCERKTNGKCLAFEQH